MAQDELKIFCDLDGTLIDVEPRHYRVYEELIRSYSGQPLAQAEYWDLKRKKTKWPELLQASNVPVNQLETFLNSFIGKIEAPEYLKIDKLFPGALSTLDSLSQKHQCYLVSLRRNREALLEQLNWLSLSSHFEEALTGHSETDGSDVKIALIESALGKNKGAIIGDTEADILAGKKLGLQTFAVWSGLRDKQFLAALQPDHLLAGISEVKDFL